MDRLIMRLGLGGIGKEPVHLSRVDIGGQVDRLIMRLGLGGGKEPVHLSRVDIGGQMDRLIMRLGLGGIGGGGGEEGYVCVIYIYYRYPYMHVLSYSDNQATLIRSRFANQAKVHL